ncbi:KLCR1 [Symbiodinium pilosum]|uniref:KLCR1 protein n=1 Tax=Symbiodinium pilosum TaxID=2952 RepID=A0A812U7F5_SYMPI|nr:KLCR1 [Symbiodinium pilosum]
MAPKTAKCLRQFCLCLTVGGLCYVQFALDFVVRQLSPEQHPRCREIVVHAAARTPAIPDFDADLGILAPLPPTASLSRYKGTAFDAEACGEACEALAAAIGEGNLQQVDGLITALKLMMPPSSGAEQAVGPPRDDFILRPEVLQWSEQDFLGGLEENMRIVQEREAKFARLMASYPQGFRAPEVLAAALDLAVVYLKNYALDKADALYEATKPHCLSRGLPWNVKWFQDCATLRCKQNRQAEAAPMLEEVAKLTPPHEATLRNLGTVYNQLREHDKAKVYFDAAAELVGKKTAEGKLLLDKEDLWNIGLVHKNKKNYDEAAPMLEQALEKWLQEDPDDDVTLAKLYDSVGSCYDEMGRFEEAVDVLQKAKSLYDRSIGTESPLYGSACERLTRALVHAHRYQEGLDNLIEAFTVIALQDAVHPTPLFELLGIALEEIPITKEIDTAELARLEMPIQAAVRNMHYRGLDQDGNCGVLFERMARALVLCSQATGDAAAQVAASQRRDTARALLRHAAPLVEAATRDGLADLTHVSMLIETELQALDNQDAAARLGIGPAPPPPPQPRIETSAAATGKAQETIPSSQIEQPPLSIGKGAMAPESTWRPR